MTDAETVIEARGVGLSYRDGQRHVTALHDIDLAVARGERVALVGQVNKFEIWDEQAWQGNLDNWLDQVADDTSGSTAQLDGITL